MMLRIFPREATSFLTRGLGSLVDCNRAVVTEAINGVYDLSFDYPFDGRRAELIEAERIVVAKTPKSVQAFRIDRIEKGLYDLHVHAYHVFYDLASYLVEDTFIQNQSGAGGLRQLLNRAGVQGFTASSDITGPFNARLVRMSALEAIMGSADQCLLNRAGGELWRDNFNIRWNLPRAEFRGASIRYRKNLTGLRFTEDYTTITTRVMPEGYDGLFLPEKYVDSPNIGSYRNPRVRVLRYPDIISRQQSPNHEDGLAHEVALQRLREAAKAEFSAGIDLPKITCDVNFVDLSQTEEYAAYKRLTAVYIGEKVRITHHPAGVDISERVISYEWDALLERYNRIALGQPETGLFDELSDVRASVLEAKAEVGQAAEEAAKSAELALRAQSKAESVQAIADAAKADASSAKNIAERAGAAAEEAKANAQNLQSSMQSTAKEAATALLKYGFGGHVRVHPDRILVMDTADESSAKNVWQWNANGIGHSDTGVNGPYKHAWTIDGHFNIQNIITDTAFINAMDAKYISAAEITSTLIRSKFGVINEIYAEKGSVGGFKIVGNALHAKTSKGEILIATDDVNNGVIYAGPGDGTYNFTIWKDGAITAKKGTIGGWTINETSIMNKGNGSIFLLNVGSTSSGYIYAGTDWGKYNFIVGKDGSVTAKKGVIGGFTIDDWRFYAGSGANHISLRSPTSSGVVFLAGGEDWNSANFAVSKTGQVKCSGAYIDGTHVGKAQLTSGSYVGSHSGYGSFGSGSFSGDGYFNSGVTVGGNAIYADSGGIFTGFVGASTVQVRGGMSGLQVIAGGVQYSLRNLSIFGRDSDIRLKEDIEDIEDELLEDIYGLPIISYTLKADPTKRRLVGINANLAAKTRSDLFTQHVIRVDKATGYYEADYTNLIGMLVKTVQDLNHRLKAIEGGNYE